MLDAPAARARRQAGIPDPESPLPWWRRAVRSGWTWGSLAVFLLCAACLWDLWSMFRHDQTTPDGEVVFGLNLDAISRAAFWAMLTLLAWIVLFLWLDRYRPQRPLVWALTLAWGATIAPWLAIGVNTWASEMMSVQGQDPLAGPATAIFIAPFVEEAAKTTALFLLAVVARYRLVNRLNVVALAGLTAAGFAFTENILYYARAYVHAARVIEAGDPNEFMMSLVRLRGLLTAFGHPMFTAMTGIGLAMGLRARSKIVRVLAPLAGFVAAAGLHMLFNGMVSTTEGNALGWWYVSALAAVFGLVVFLLTTVLSESVQIKSRLTDYVRMGWLRPSDPVTFSGPIRRTKLCLAGAFRGWRTLRATLAICRTMTELAYLRDSMSRGVVDEPGVQREKELLGRIGELRATALHDLDGLRVIPRGFFRFLRRRKAERIPPAYPGPAGLGGNWPAPQASTRKGAAPRG